MGKVLSYAKYFALLLAFAFYVFCFEPFGVAELAYVFGAILYVLAKNGGFSFKRWAIFSFLFAWLAWGGILAWLRFVYPPAGIFFAVALSAIMALFFFVWLVALKKFVPSSEAPFFRRFGAILFLASLWVALEWIRSFIFTGFPWLLLAHSQWQRPAIIQIASIGGAYMVSFVLIFFNLGLGEYVCKLWAWHKKRIAGEHVTKFERFAPEFYFAAFLVLLSLYAYIADMPRLENKRKLFRAGMVQTDFAGLLNWNADMGVENLNALKKMSLGLKNARVDLLVWSESAMPPMWPLIGTEGLDLWVENLSRQMNVPILVGDSAYIRDEEGERRFNAAFVVTPDDGLNRNFYAKQKLVPFGEYVPKWCFFIDSSVVPVGRMTPGSGPVLLEVKVAQKNFKFAPIICYEDIFPQIALEAARAGADILYVCTNDSWYGREGGAWQHAAHSAFQAVATRKPLVRASVNGLSGVFDQYGRLVPTIAMRSKDGGIFNAKNEPDDVLDLSDEYGQAISPRTFARLRGCPLLNDEGSIYFQGAGYADVVAYSNFDGVVSFYVRYGDWFAKACVFYCLLFYFVSHLFPICKLKFLRQRREVRACKI